jgi:SRSO17 transposase
MVDEVVALGFPFSVVLADSLDGESGDFTSALHRLGLR